MIGSRATRWTPVSIFVLVLFLLSTTAVPAAAAREAKTRTTTQVYLALTGLDADCDEHWGGACFALLPDETEAAVSVVDDSGLRPTSARYELRDASGEVLETALFCETTTLAIPSGARELAVLVAAVDVLACGQPATATTGVIRVVTKISDGAFEPYHVEPQECLQATPTAISVAGVTEPLDQGQRVSLDALVLLDGVSQQRGREIMEATAEAYEPLGIDLRTRFRPVSLPPAHNGQLLISHAMEAVGGEVPKGFDVVHALTDKSLNVSGQASCIGGVRYRDRAFSISRAAANPLVAAHEIGHTMGAHHHYGNCLESLIFRDQMRCTVMVSNPHPLIFAWEPRFSTMNGAIVRAHAVRYADGPDQDGP